MPEKRQNVSELIVEKYYLRGAEQLYGRRPAVTKRDEEENAACSRTDGRRYVALHASN